MPFLCYTSVVLRAFAPPSTVVELLLHYAQQLNPGSYWAAPEPKPKCTIAGGTLILPAPSCHKRVIKHIYGTRRVTIASPGAAVQPAGYPAAPASGGGREQNGVKGGWRKGRIRTMRGWGLRQPLLPNPNLLQGVGSPTQVSLTLRPLKAQSQGDTLTLQWHYLG